MEEKLLNCYAAGRAGTRMRRKNRSHGLGHASDIEAAKRGTASHPPSGNLTEQWAALACSPEDYNIAANLAAEDTVLQQ